PEEARDAVVAIRSKDGQLDHTTLPQFARTTLRTNPSTGAVTYGRNLSAMTTLLTETVRAQQAEIDELTTQMADVLGRLEKLEGRGVSP
ncbi:hypothetical protein LCGC14_2745630, partial [marine sediment metagenome]